MEQLLLKLKLNYYDKIHPTRPLRGDGGAWKTAEEIALIIEFNNKSNNEQ